MPTTPRLKLLIIDDDAQLRKQVGMLFQAKGWTVKTAPDGRVGVLTAKNFLPDIILSDVEMPYRDGITTCRILKNDTQSTVYYPIIMMTASKDKKKIMQCIEAGCDDFIVKPFTDEIVIGKVEKLLAEMQKKKKVETLDQQMDNLEEHSIIVYSKQVIQNIFNKAQHNQLIEYKVVTEVVDNMVGILQDEKTLPIAFKMKSYNDYTYIHSVNVASLCMSFGFHLGWDTEDLQAMGEGGFLHDVGKVKVPLNVLLKPGKLTNEEFDEIKKHPLYGEEILRKQGIGDTILRPVLEHHERVNGTGYPHGLKGDEISKLGRISAIVDVYDALTTDRCYHRGVETEKAIEIMKKGEGHFDEQLFLKFQELILGGTIGKN